MNYQKFAASCLFDGYRFHPQGSVLVLTANGEVEDILSPDDAGDDVQQLTGILSPGFINCHVHLELSHMRGKIPEGTGLVDFVQNVITQRQADETTIFEAIEQVENEMLENGIVAAGDICNNALSIRQKIKKRIWYHNFIEASGFNPAIVEDRFKRSLAFFEAYSNLYSIPIASNSITPHAPYSVADPLWDKIIHFPGNHLFSIHNQESADEDAWFRNKSGGLSRLYENMKMDVDFFKATGKSSIQSYLGKFLKNQTVILVHNVHTTEEDIRFAKQTNLSLYWCLCPNANLYISRTLPDLPTMLRNDCEIILGTDSLASNHKLSILEEIKTLQKHFPDIQLETMLVWATSNGAKALDLQALMGSFEKGKKPGLILINEDLSGIKRLA